MKRSASEEILRSIDRNERIKGISLKKINEQCLWYGDPGTLYVQAKRRQNKMNPVIFCSELRSIMLVYIKLADNLIM